MKKPLKTPNLLLLKEETKPGRRTKVMLPSCTEQISLTIQMGTWSQFEDVNDSSKQFCHSLAPSNLLFLTNDCLYLECNKLVFTRLRVRSSLSIFFYHMSIIHNAYGEVQSCQMQGLQCYRHIFTRYLIFKNVSVYGILLESTSVT